MVATRRLNIIVLSVLVGITVVNLGLALTFVTSGSHALPAALTSETVFLSAGIELAAVLLVYVIYKHRAFPAQSQSSQTPER